MKQKTKWRGIILALTAAILWGVSGTCGQFLFMYRNINTEWLVTVRLLIAGILLLLIAMRRHPSEVFAIWQDKKSAAQLLVFSILGMLAVQYTFFATIKHSNAATATVLQYSGPVMIAVYMAWHSRKWPTFLEYLAIALAVAGTFLMVTHGKTDSLSISVQALGWGLASALSMAFYSIYPAQLLSRYPTPVIIGWAMVTGGTLLGFTHAPWNVSGEWDFYTLAFTAFIILLGCLVAFYAYLTAVKIIGPQTTSLLASAEPLSAAVFSLLWLKVPFTVMDWLGSLCIISTIFLLARKKQPTTAAVRAVAESPVS
ncbi:EamA family transporter [Chitinophaga sp. 212800010-3]|uniref:DMT family transporter n=1 Tax=unclassified Chitinophaga TaxID=2619133 RepID=UPI002DEDB17E|nr:EamA family transporter [Chitinophaga sp. 212800010-3]